MFLSRTILLAGIAFCVASIFSISSLSIASDCGYDVSEFSDSPSSSDAIRAVMASMIEESKKPFEARDQDFALRMQLAGTLGKHLRVIYPKSRFTVEPERNNLRSPFPFKLAFRISGEIQNKPVSKQARIILPNYLLYGASADAKFSAVTKVLSELPEHLHWLSWSQIVMSQPCEVRLVLPPEGQYFSIDSLPSRRLSPKLVNQLDILNGNLLMKTGRRYGIHNPQIFFSSAGVPLLFDFDFQEETTQPAIAQTMDGLASNREALSARIQLRMKTTEVRKQQSPKLMLEALDFWREVVTQDLLMALGISHLLNERGINSPTEPPRFLPVGLGEQSETIKNILRQLAMGGRIPDYRMFFQHSRMCPHQLSENAVRLFLSGYGLTPGSDYKTFQSIEEVILTLTVLEHELRVLRDAYLYMERMEETTGSWPKKFPNELVQHLTSRSESDGQPRHFFGDLKFDLGRPPQETREAFYSRLEPLIAISDDDDEPRAMPRHVADALTIMNNFTLLTHFPYTPNVQALTVKLEAWNRRPRLQR